MFFYTWVCLDAPHLFSPIHLYAPICLYTPRGVHTPHMPPILLCICMFLEALHVVGGSNGLPFVLGHFPYTTPVWGCLSFIYTPPHPVVGSQYISMFQGIISMLCRHFPSVEGFGGVLPISWGFRGHQHLRCPYAHSCTFFVVHYVSCFYYSSNYNSSGYSGIFWPVISVVNHSGSFPDRVSSKLGSAWCGSTTTLDAEMLWRCSWLSFCATAANSIFNASSRLCQLCYGFSTGRFLFQS